MKPIILIAPPQAGKGTLAKMLVTKYNLPHISTGDLLREEVASGSERGKELEEKMSKGILIDDETMINLIVSRINKEDCNNGYILDGFPRTIEQARAHKEALDKLGKDLGNVFILEIPFELALKRVIGRVVCPACGMSHNTILEETKPKIDGICDKCGANLIKRSDDNEESLTKRFAVYNEQTSPIIDYYDEFGNVYRISGEDKDIAFAEVEKILNGDN